MPGDKGTEPPPFSAEPSPMNAADMMASKILIHEALLLFLKRACTTQFPLLQKILDGYLISMASASVVSAMIQSLECRKTLLQLSSEIGLANDPELRVALRTDEERIATLLVSIFNSKSDEAAVLCLEGDSAQHFLDVVQETLDKGFLMAEEHSRMARRIVRKLSESCDKFPSSLFIAGVSGREEHPTFGGGYGDIFRALHDNNPVALKRMRHFLRGSDLRRIRLKFCREALVWRDLDHPHILPFLGIERDSFPSALCMVSPWMEHGTVMNYLRVHGHANVDQLLFEIAQGLQYLHSRNIVHGDLRGANILINENCSASLADFGLSIFSDATSSMSTNRGGSLYWMAPELLDPDRFGCKFARTPASDVYAFACVCLELYTGRPPFSELPEPTAMLKVINGERPEPPSGSPTMSAVLWQNVTAYWAGNPTGRPMTEVVVQDMVWPVPLPLLSNVHFSSPRRDKQNLTAANSPNRAQDPLQPEQISLNTPIHQQSATRALHSAGDNKRWKAVDQLSNVLPSLPVLNPAALAIPPSQQPLREKSAPDLSILMQEPGHVREEHSPEQTPTSSEAKKEKRKFGFWWSGTRKDHDREPAETESIELTRKIGFLTATASEDYTLVLDVCDHASATEANAKEAVHALRREFKYGEPAAQLAATRLWAIMLRNASDTFISQSTSRKFLDTLEDLLTSSRTSPVVRERVMGVLAAAAYASQGPKKDVGFRGLWRRVKPHDTPEEGMPFDKDTMFNPPLMTSSAYDSGKNSTDVPDIIPPHEDMHRLFQECKIGVGNATLLSEALAMATLEQVGDTVIVEFQKKCMASQELISTQISGVSASVERSRREGLIKEQETQTQGHMRKFGANMLSSVNSNGNGTMADLGAQVLTREEELLADLFAANERLLKALKLYNNLKRVALRREAEDRSRQEVRIWNQVFLW